MTIPANFEPRIHRLEEYRNGEKLIHLVFNNENGNPMMLYSYWDIFMSVFYITLSILCYYQDINIYFRVAQTLTFAFIGISIQILMFKIKNNGQLSHNQIKTITNVSWTSWIFSFISFIMGLIQNSVEHDFNSGIYIYKDIMTNPPIFSLFCFMDIWTLMTVKTIIDKLDYLRMG